MKNNKKDELRREVVRLGIAGYDKKRIIEIMEKREFKKQTISNYYESLKHKFAKSERDDKWKYMEIQKH